MTFLPYSVKKYQNNLEGIAFEQQLEISVRIHKISFNNINP